MRQKTHTKTLAFVVALTVLAPLVVFAAASDQELVATRQEFDELWHLAAETTKRRATLEENLSKFDTKVADARRDLEQASGQRKVIREQIAERRKLIEALQQQLKAAQETRAFYEAVAVSQRDDFVRFIQYMVSRNIADSESGPAVDPLFKQILKGSLGQSIDDQLARDAVLQARTRFFGQVKVLVAEAGRIEQELLASAKELDAELQLLEKQLGAVSSLVEEKNEFIDLSWKIKKLTEDELKAVVREANEANERIASIQSSLKQINDELKAGKTEKLDQELAALESKKNDLQSEKEALGRKDRALELLQQAVADAHEAAIARKRTDKKLYRTVEVHELELGRKQEELLLLEAQITTQTGSALHGEKVKTLKADVIFLTSLITLMKDGVPEAPAQAYLEAKSQAEGSALERAIIRKRVLQLDADIAKLDEDILKKKQEIQTIEKQHGLDGLPPMFRWPVSGPITAGYLDSDYVNVFGVPHRGMDIATAQATPVKAISDGVVFAYKDGGATGYSYILIGHRNGYASLYGHVSSSFVKAGDTVDAGQIIGLSGGKPGTHGAGYMTTGAHLHLEITKDGKHVDPGTVLPAK